MSHVKEYESEAKIPAWSQVILVFSRLFSVCIKELAVTSMNEHVTSNLLPSHN